MSADMATHTQDTSEEWILIDTDNSSLTNSPSRNDNNPDSPKSLDKSNDTRPLNNDINVVEGTNSTNTLKSSKSNSKNSNNNMIGSIKRGIPSSPSFNELSTAIGLALNFTNSDSNGDLSSVGFNNNHNNNYSHQHGHHQSNSPNKFRSSPKPKHINNGMNKKYSNVDVHPTSPLTVGTTIGVGGISPGTSGNTISQEINVNKVVEAARSELSLFSNEAESRALIIFHSPLIHTETIRSACQQYGVLFYMRPEFHSKGVTLLSYFDVRSAINAKAGLTRDLAGEGNHVTAHFSIMLQAALNTDESKLIVKKLPKDQTSNDIESIFQRYGPLRSIQRCFDGNSGNNVDNNNNDIDKLEFTIEYYNIQDARLAASELIATSAELWDAETEIQFAPLDSRQQQFCKQLLAILARWRNELPVNRNNNSTSFPIHVHNNNGVRMPHNSHAAYAYGPYNGMINSNMAVMMPFGSSPMYNSDGQVLYPAVYGQQQMMPMFPTMQTNSQGQAVPISLVGQYHASMDYRGNNNMMDNKIIDTEGKIIDPQDMRGSSHYVDRHIHNRNHHQNQSKRSNLYKGSDTNSDFTLSLENILNGTELRTTLMVRNIPNKYTQMSVLEEINVKHEGLYDFFYLPIDFKNKCNVGYAFINFIDPIHVAKFYNDFNGSRWKNFNSEKVCAVAFARIQGKSAMIARFQNSSLLEKDNEYRPLLFHSSGPDKGKPELFPTVSRSNSTFRKQGEP